MRRRLDLGASLVAQPPVLILDEPTTGLDPRSRMDLWQSIEVLVAGGTTVLLTTQYLEEADRLAHKIVVLDKGRIIAEGTADELKNRLGGDRLDMTVATASGFAEAVKIVSRLCEGAVPQVDVDQRRVSLPAREGAQTLTTALRSLDEAGIVLDDISLHRPSLDDVFLAMTGHVATEDHGSAPGPRRRRLLPRRSDT
jgi:ABC-2 type transport system ATP-binding protein